jgi:hypothetical protein
MILIFALFIMSISSISLFFYLSYLTSQGKKEIKGLPKAKKHDNLTADLQPVDFAEEYALVEAM